MGSAEPSGEANGEPLSPAEGSGEANGVPATSAEGSVDVNGGPFVKEEAVDTHKKFPHIVIKKGTTFSSVQK